MASRRRGFSLAPLSGVRSFVAVALLAAVSGCTYSVAADAPAEPMLPLPPSFQPTVEYTVADFTVALGGNDPAPSIFDGRQLSAEILEVWQQRGYIRGQCYVDDAAFTGYADYHLTLRGSHHGETSFTLQVLNALTLSLLPYTVTECYDFEYALEDVKRGTTYYGAVRASDKTWVHPFLIFALPFADRGHRTTMDRVGEELYDQFQRQGAFTSGAPPEQPEAEARGGSFPVSSSANGGG